MTPGAADLADLLGRLEAVGTLAPELVCSELRPVVERLEARRRVCSGCGAHFLSKRDHRRPRSFCCDDCRHGLAPRERVISELAGSRANAAKCAMGLDLTGLAS